MNVEEKRQGVTAAKALAKEGKDKEAFLRLRAIADPCDDFTLQSRYSKVYRSLDPESLGLRSIRIALVGSSTLEHFSDVFGFWLALEGFRLSLYLSPYGTITQSILDPDSDLYKFSPEMIWIFSTQGDIRFQVNPDPGHSVESVAQAVRSTLDDLSSLWKAIHSRCPAYILQNNADLPAERIFGNLEGMVLWSRANLLRRFNLDLAGALPPGSTLFDLEHISSLFGKHLWFDRRYWFHSKHAFSIEASGIVAFHAARLIGALKGTAKKCIVLDLDNTLWGGIVGEDGLDGIRLGNGADGEAFVAFQEYLKALGDRGILLAVCSKNEESNAKEPFLSHPDMRLRLDDISVFKANWNNKADNIHEIAAILNIGLDSMVFVDDNPAERDLIRTMLPMVTVPEMPADPAEYVNALDRLRLFEAVSFSIEDKIRGRMYRDNAVREEHRQKFSDLSHFLKSLDMEATVGCLDGFHLKRVSQLINKSNQFHLTGTRYTDSEIEALNINPEYIFRYFKLKDKFGDSGLVAAVILKREQDTLAIDTWVMSCRVLSRGMEEFVCNEVLSIARERSCRRVLGRYVPSKKNRLVCQLYGKLGFDKVCEKDDGETLWEYVLGGRDSMFQVHIRRVGA